MKLTLESIRERFPNPVKCVSPVSAGEYCVGGAFLQTLGIRWPFPTARQIQQRLMRQNAALDGDSASDFAEAITDANDSGDFETAWAKLGEALSYGGVA